MSDRAIEVTGRSIVIEQRQEGHIYHFVIDRSKVRYVRTEWAKGFVPQDAIARIDDMLDYARQHAETVELETIDLPGRD